MMLVRRRQPIDQLRRNTRLPHGRSAHGSQSSGAISASGSALTAVIAQHLQDPRAAFGAAAIAGAAAAVLTLSTRPILDRSAVERT